MSKHTEMNNSILLKMECTNMEKSLLYLKLQLGGLEELRVQFWK